MTTKAIATLSSPAMKFAAKFALLFALGMGAFEASRGTAFERFVVEDCLLKPTVALINAVTPGEQVLLMGRMISSANSHLRVTRGCEGVEMFLMLISAVLAYPLSWKRRLHGLFFGSLLAYALSVARLMALHYILRYSPSAWEALHGLVLPLGPIILITLYFLRWSAGTAPRRPDSEEPRAA